MATLRHAPENDVDLAATSESARLDWFHTMCRIRAFEREILMLNRAGFGRTGSSDQYAPRPRTLHCIFGRADAVSQGDSIDHSDGGRQAAGDKFFV
jgi:TPP-dependent pyruvate/acetoin dehydrogenase alpha subunit